MFRLTHRAVALGVLVLVCATIAACSPASRLRAPAAIARFASRAVDSRSSWTSGAAADTDWSVAAHVNW